MRVGDPLEDELAGGTPMTVGSPTVRAETTARAAGLRGEQVMANRQHPDPFGGESAQVRSCWMCGIRLPAGQLVADGGNACPDVRWYCRDVWGCTRRWTSHPARLTAIRPDVVETEESGELAAGLVPAGPMTKLGPRTGFTDDGGTDTALTMVASRPRWLAIQPALH